jgi:hypothetical protein
MFGGIISMTDTVAIVALLKEVGKINQPTRYN